MTSLEGGGPHEYADELFYEQQYFTQWWYRLLVVGTAAIAWASWVQQIVLGEPFGSEPAPDGVVWALWIAMGVVLPVAALALRLVTSVRPGQVRVGFPPFPRRVVATDRILDVQATEIRPIAHWGGYGYRRNLKGGTAFIVRGTAAVRLALPDQKVVVIGSQRAERLATAIETARTAGG